MKTWLKKLEGFRGEQRGVAAIELAIALPILTVCALCAGDLGRYALQKTWVAYAASAGAEYAVAHGAASIANIKTAATSAAPGDISASPDPSVFHGCATAAGVTSSTQGATCPSTGGVAGQYVSVTTTMPFTAMFSAAGVSYPSTLSATAVVRIQ